MVSSKDSVLEIGPGDGILTKALAQHASQVLCIEIDQHLINQLQTWIPANVTIIHGDVMKTDLAQLPKWNKCVSNLPYQISSPFTFILLHHQFETAVLMYQKDFADRLIAKPRTKQYSRLTVHVYYKAQCTLLERVPRTQFHPQPKVDSALIQLKPRSSPPFDLKDESLFFQLTTLLFTHRRKTIKTSLRNLLGSHAQTVSYATRRVEELSPEEIGFLTNEVFNLLHS
jgi:16S rRNA (adenine1518-N6/adenine1519-N6)-dimethyltransferase